MFDQSYAQVAEYYYRTLPCLIHAEVMSNREAIFEELHHELKDAQIKFVHKSEDLTQKYEGKIADKKANLQDKTTDYQNRIRENQTLSVTEYNDFMREYRGTGKIKYQTKAEEKRDKHLGKVIEYQTRLKKVTEEITNDLEKLQLEFSSKKQELADNYQADLERINYNVQNSEAFLSAYITQEISKKAFTTQQVETLISEYKILCVYTERKIPGVFVNDLRYYQFPALATIELVNGIPFATFCGERQELGTIDKVTNKNLFELYPIVQWPKIALDLISNCHITGNGIIQIASNGICVLVNNDLTFVGTGNVINGKMQNPTCKIYNNQVYFF